jgi:hypothetical protein
MDAAEDDRLGARLRGGLGERQAVADDVGDVLEIRLVVIVSQDDGMALLLQALDLGRSSAGLPRLPP